MHNLKQQQQQQKLMWTYNIVEVLPPGIVCFLSSARVHFKHTVTFLFIPNKSLLQLQDMHDFAGENLKRCRNNIHS